MSEVDFDLDAVVVEAETAEPFRFTWKGETWELPLMDALEFADQIALESANVEDSLRLLMGDDQWERFIAHPISTGRARELIRRWQKWQGLEPGESPASSRSSRSTARRSKRSSRSGR